MANRKRIKLNHPRIYENLGNLNAFHTKSGVGNGADREIVGLASLRRAITANLTKENSVYKITPFL